MAFGPTQNYNDESLGVWKPRPLLAAVVRGTLLALPVLFAVAFGLATVHWLPPQRLGMNPWVWLVAQVACSTALLLVLGRQVRRALPLTTLLRLTLYFPDRAPSRLAVARRTHSPEALRQRVAAAERGGRVAGAADLHALRLLELVGALNAHDRTTFSHSERVQAYAALIGTALGLLPGDAAKLSWAALLHDIGKLHVPREILNKSGRPTSGEWQVLATHPSEGAVLAAPLREWLGPWLGAIEQHHERWDGHGYPHGLAGTQISHAARIVAVADAYDVITTARPYKKPLSAAAARAELARCAGEQFDPEVVRAFLTVGLGRLRVVAGPVSAISALPALRAMPLPDLTSTVSSVVHAVPALGATATATVVAAALTVADPLLLPTPHDDVVSTAGSETAVVDVEVTDPTGPDPSTGFGFRLTPEQRSGGPGSNPTPTPAADRTGAARGPADRPGPSGPAQGGPTPPPGRPTTGTPTEPRGSAEPVAPDQQAVTTRAPSPAPSSTPAPAPAPVPAPSDSPPPPTTGTLAPAPAGVSGPGAPQSSTDR